MRPLVRVMYRSRNRAGGVARDGIAGDLMVEGCRFTQVLEGPSDAVERTFERIQCDDRHTEIRVLEARPIRRRDFPSWSMALHRRLERYSSCDRKDNLALSAARHGAFVRSRCVGEGIGAFHYHAHGPVIE